MTAPQQPPSADDAVGDAADRAGGPDGRDTDTDVVLSTDEDEQRDDLTVRPGNS